MEAELVGVDLVEDVLTSEPLDQRIWSIDTEYFASEAGADRAGHRRGEHEALDVLGFSAKHFLGEVAE